MYALSELRHDNTFGRLVIIPNKRYDSNGKCPYCLNNENMDKRMIVALVEDGNMLKKVYEASEARWRVRVFESEEPIVTTNGVEEAYNNTESAYGYHYILALSPDHQSPCKLSIEQWSDIFLILQDTIKLLYTKKGVAYVAVYMSNTRNTHPHMDIVSFSRIPPSIEKEALAIRKGFIENSSCPVCDMIKSDGEERRVYKNNNFIAFCPWSSTYEYEFMIIPQKHMVDFVTLTQKYINDLAHIVRVTLGALYNIQISKGLTDEFNLVFHLPPVRNEKKQFHWYINIYPVSKIPNVLASEFDIHINRLRPEDAAAELSIASRKEFAELMGVR